jgi:hypothetical protein
MMQDENHCEGHERFQELSALANSGTLNPGEWRELKRHLQVCEDCREIHDHYRLLSTVGMPFLAATYDHPQEHEGWDDTRSRERLLGRLDAAGHLPEPALTDLRPSTPPHLLLGIGANHGSANLLPALNQWVKLGMAACLGIGLVFGAYSIGGRAHNGDQQRSLSSQRQMQQLALEKRWSDNLVESQVARISEMQEQNARQEQEAGKLRTALHALENRSRELEAADGTTKEQLREIAEEGDRLKTQLQQAEQSNQNLKSELVNLHAEHDRTLLHTTSLESKLNELTAASRDQERRVEDDERFLASDRDIRELMGARKLYIADVFDVDSGSRTRKPFGRIFYTQNKSLIFYAFDLDRQAGVKAASIFQVWGQRETELLEKPHAMNLGILYMDSESNQRWVLRLDDSKQLAQIDAVFVTVEPHGGSRKPTGKPFLYALLRKEANHP